MSFCYRNSFFTYRQNTVWTNIIIEIVILKFPDKAENYAVILIPFSINVVYKLRSIPTIYFYMFTFEVADRLENLKGVQKKIREKIRVRWQVFTY